MAGTHSPLKWDRVKSHGWSVCSPHALHSTFAHAGLSLGSHPKGSTLELLHEAGSLISNQMDGLPPVTPQPPLHPALQ